MEISEDLPDIGGMKEQEIRKRYKKDYKKTIKKLIDKCI